MLSEVRTGPIISADAAVNPARGDRTGAGVITDAHGRFREAARLNKLFSGGMTLTSIANATFTTATTGATATPIIGIWNPFGSGKIASILQARLQLITTALSTPTGPGALMWVVAVNQSALTLGVNAFSRLSLLQAGAVCKVFAGVALTGISGVLSTMEASGFSTYPTNVTAAETAAGFMPAAPGGIENIDGAFEIPPGGFLGLQCTTTPVAISAASSILWEEIDQ